MLLMHFLHCKINFTSNLSLYAYLNKIISCSVYRLNNLALISDFVQKKADSVREILFGQNLHQMKMQDHQLKIYATFEFVYRGILCFSNSLINTFSAIEIYFFVKFWVSIKQRTNQIPFDCAKILYKLLNVFINSLSYSNNVM